MIYAKTDESSQLIGIQHPLSGIYSLKQHYPDSIRSQFLQ